MAIWKILKTESTTLSDDLFLCQASKGSAVRFELNIFCTLVTMATAVILNLLNPQQLPHTTVDIPTKFHDVWWKESKTIFNLPFFVSMVAVAKFVPPIPICLVYLVPLDVDVVPNKFHQLISKPQNYVYTCQTKFLESFIQFQALIIFCVFCGFHGNGGHFENSTQTMDINSQHHNLLGKQISPKSEDFCIVAAIFGSKSWAPP